MEWAYGVTTVPPRSEYLLPRTLRSLELAGFDQPRLFVDGCEHSSEYHRRYTHLPLTTRCPKVGGYASWYMALTELYLRQPKADRYAIFQDDLITYRNLRWYLERSPYPDRGYLNLYTFPSNQQLSTGHGWYLSNQYGRGAVALVFDQATIRQLLTSVEMIEKPLHVAHPTDKIDGSVVTALAKCGWKEWVHDPSLVQHIGEVSTVGHPPQLSATSFRGEQFDAASLIDKIDK